MINSTDFDTLFMTDLYKEQTMPSQALRLRVWFRWSSEKTAWIRLGLRKL